MIPLFLILATLTLDLYTDIRRRKRGIHINHLRGWLLRVPPFAVAVWLNPWSAGLAFTYWMLFDLGFSLLTGRGLWYLGNARLDMIQKRFKWIVAVKIVLGVGAVVGYLIFSR